LSRYTAKEKDGDGPEKVGARLFEVRQPPLIAAMVCYFDTARRAILSETPLSAATALMSG